MDPRPRSNRPWIRRHARALQWLERGLWLGAAVALAWVAGSWIDGLVYQLREGHRLEELTAAAAEQALPAEIPGEDDEEATALPPPPPLEVGEPIGRLVIPRLGVDVVVAHGSDSRTLRRAAGHVPGSALPGYGGNVALAGHRDRHFRSLKDVVHGDEIELVTPDGTFRYRVAWTHIVDPVDAWVLARTPEPALTLVTCYPFNYVGSAPRRFVVRARQVATELAPGLELAAR